MADLTMSLFEWAFKNEQRKKHAAYMREWNRNNRAHVSEFRRRNRKKRRAILAAQEKMCRDREKARDPVAFNKKSARKQKRWRDRNPEKRNAAKRRAYLKETEETRIVRRLRGRFYRATKSAGGGAAIRLLGCPLPVFRSHIERLFRDGMSWANYGRKGWHFDHIIPLAAFDLTDPSQLAVACHYTNIQPLWWQDNIAKGVRQA